MPIETANSAAFKEWASVCGALGRGLQTIILRKGGVDEGRDGFRVKHGEFWLYPTLFHQQPGQLTETGAEQLPADGNPGWPDGLTPIRLYAAVAETRWLEHEAQVERLAGQHVWSPETVQQRFHYRRPGLFVLVVRIYALAEPILVVETPEMAGCRSWVDLPEPLPTVGLVPVLTDEQFAEAKSRLAAVL